MSNAMKQNIEIPPYRAGCKNQTGLSQKLRKMKVGESIQIPKETRNSVCAAARYIGIRCATRCMGSDTEVTVLRIS